MWRLLPVLLVCCSLSARADWQPISVQFRSMAAPGGQRAGADAGGDDLQAERARPVPRDGGPAPLRRYRSRLLAVAGRLSKLGYVAIVPDSFRSHGVNRVG